MRTAQIQSVRRGRTVRTTIPNDTNVRASDRMDRDFTARGPDELWVMGFTYCSTWQGWLYVAFVLDVYSRTIVVWAAFTTMTADLTLHALEMAAWKQNRPLAGLTALCDAGSQYIALRFTEKANSSNPPGHGKQETNSNTPHSNGSTGTTPAAYTNRSA